MKNRNHWIIRVIWTSFIATATVAKHSTDSFNIVHLDSTRLRDLAHAIDPKCASSSAHVCHLQSVMMILFIGTCVGTSQIVNASMHQYIHQDIKTIIQSIQRTLDMVDI